MKFYFLKLFLFTSIILIGCRSTESNQTKTIAIQPFKGFNTSFIDTISTTLKSIYQVEIIQLKPIDLPKIAFTNFKAPRYRADSLIRFLKREKHDSINYILGLTSKDICITKLEKDGSIKKPINKYKDFGIFGLGFRPGNSCIVSSFRLQKNNPNLFLERLQKVCIHEVGHNYGLKHCELDEKCVMRSAAESIKTVDNIDLKLCENCKAIIKL